MSDTLSQTFAALADPTRRAMLAHLSRGQANVSELARPFLRGMSLPAVTKHLKVLEKAGLITKTREAQWWGPRGFTLTTHSKDLRSGGSWNYTMHGPDGVDYPNKTQYLEVEKYSKLVYDHGGNDDRSPLFRVTVLFSELNGKTKMDMTM